MRKLSVTILIVLVVTSSLFATDVTSDGVSVFVEAPDNKISIGFATSLENAKNAVPATADFNLGKIPLTPDLKFKETTYSDQIFVFYRAVVDSNSNYTLTLELKKPFTYWTGSTYGSDTIDYTATVKKPTSYTKWDGSNYANISNGTIAISSNSNPLSADLESNLRGSSTNYVVSGIAQVEIYIPETEISEKKYGRYKTEMTLKLTTTP